MQASWGPCPVSKSCAAAFLPASTGTLPVTMGRKAGFLLSCHHQLVLQVREPKRHWDCLWPHKPSLCEAKRPIFGSSFHPLVGLKVVPLSTCPGSACQPGPGTGHWLRAETDDSLQQGKVMCRAVCLLGLPLLSPSAFLSAPPEEPNIHCFRKHFLQNLVCVWRPSHPPSKTTKAVLEVMKQ